MHLGLSSFTFGWAVGVPGHPPERPLDEQGLLDKCRELGVTLLQIGDNLPLHEFPQKRLTGLAERAAQEGIRLEIGARRLTHERIRDYAGIARLLGARLVRFVIDDRDYHPAPEAVARVLRESIPLLDGLTLALENHDRFPAAVLRQIIAQAETDTIGVCLDTANSLGAGEGLDTVLAALAPLTVNLHIKDFQIERVPHLMGFAVSGRPAGQGMLNLPALLAQLAPYRRCQTAVLELWTPPEAQLKMTIAREAAWAVESIASLRKIMQDQPCPPTT